MSIKCSSCTLVLLMVLAACGGGGSDGTFADEAEALTTRYSMASPPDPGELSGEATMSGFLGFAINSPTEINGMTGDLDVVANFETNTINGTGSALRDPEDLDQMYEGELALEGVITDDTFSGSMIGVITGTSDDEGAISTFTANVVLGVLDGQFRTDNDGFLALADLSGETDLEIETGGAPSVFSDLATGGLLLVGE